MLYLGYLYLYNSWSLVPNAADKLHNQVVNEKNLPWHSIAFWMYTWYIQTVQYKYSQIKVTAHLRKLKLLNVFVCFKSMIHVTVKKTIKRHCSKKSHINKKAIERAINCNKERAIRATNKLINIWQNREISVMNDFAYFESAISDTCNYEKNYKETYCSEKNYHELRSWHNRAQVQRSD